ncbi:hypothetical protein [Microbacterium sp. KR10-403]|uniref:hypothetical protein n=1 Tax=Microbacterium sp. KR10-403 TaxID=3158581 RepID=UPI0032E463F0
MKTALGFLAVAVLILPVWAVTGYQQNGLWLLGLVCAVIGLFGIIADSAPTIPEDHPDSLGSLDIAERAHRSPTDGASNERTGR